MLCAVSFCQKKAKKPARQVQAGMQLQQLTQTKLKLFLLAIN
jgi:hypothetical protein